MRVRIFVLGLAICLAGNGFAKGKRNRSAPTTRGVASEADASALTKIATVQEQRKDPEKYLEVALRHSSKAVVRAALLAMARVVEPAYVESLAGVLNRKDRSAQLLAAFALGQIGGDVSLKLLTQNLQLQTDGKLKAALVLAMGRSGQESLLGNLETLLSTEKDPQVLEAALEALGTLLNAGTDKTNYSRTLFPLLLQLASQDSAVGAKAAYALSRYRGAPAVIPVASLVPILNASTGARKNWLLRVAARAKDALLSPILIKTLTSDSTLATRVEAAKAMAGTPITDPALVKSWMESLPKLPTPVLYESLISIGSLGAEGGVLTPSLLPLLSHPSVWIQGQTLKTLARTNPPEARKQIENVWKNPASPLSGSAVMAMSLLGGSKDTAAIPALLNRLSRVELVAFLEFLVAEKNEEVQDAIREPLKVFLARADGGLTTVIAEIAGTRKWKDYGPLLQSVYPRLTPDQVEARNAVVTAFEALGIAHPGIVAGQPLPLPPALPLPPTSEWKAATGRKIKIETSRGTILIQTLDVAPITSSYFLKFIKAGLYSGKTFHRVVPGFVVQGGDPRGDGYGGPGFLIRDEVSPEPHLRGTVGIATAGKDTGGSQFFFNLADNLHLNGRYTLFAKVVSGMEVADRLEPGDLIQSVTVVP